MRGDQQPSCMPDIIAIRADSVSGGLQPIHIAVKFIPDDCWNDGWIRQSSLSPPFSPLVLSALEYLQSHSGAGPSCAAIQHSHA